MKIDLNIPEEFCLLCQGKKDDMHHIFGGIRRPKSDEYGLLVPLCRKHHQLAHTDKDVQEYLHEFGQRAFEKVYSREQFMTEFGKNYLDDYEDILEKFEQEHAEELPQRRRWDITDPPKNERQCPICGKIFYPCRGWAYKIDPHKSGFSNCVCSYSCSIKAGQQNRAKRRYKSDYDQA